MFVGRVSEGNDIYFEKWVWQRLLSVLPGVDEGLGVCCLVVLVAFSASSVGVDGLEKL